jgi:predicted RNA-binding Zn ribbon-like protein
VEPVDEILYMNDHEPAPGRLKLVQRFVNTVDYEHGREVLSEPSRLRRLLVELGLVPADVTVTAADLRRALAVREALRAVALANNGRPAGQEQLAILERTAADGRLAVRFDGPRAVLVPEAPGVRGALAELVGIVYTAMADGTWTRLKACSRDVCGWLFYDRSRNRSARWCQMAVCGNRTKTRAYRTRRRTA